MSNVQSMFRGQLVFDDQVAMYEYWNSKCVDNHLPSRNDIRPSEFARFLPQVSLIDVCRNAGATSFRYRLAGTALRQQTGRELTGHSMDELFDAPVAEYWNRTLSGLAERKRPSCGGVRRNCPAHDHLGQFWLRLPLVDGNGEVNTILGLDLFVPISNLTHENLRQLASA